MADVSGSKGVLCVRGTFSGVIQASERNGIAFLDRGI